jgi:hypothetical protein
VTSSHRAIAFGSLQEWRQAPAWTSRRRSSAPLRSSFAATLNGDLRISSPAPATLTAVELVRKPPSGQPSGATNPQPPQGKGREKHVARKMALSAPAQTGLAHLPKTSPRAGIFRNGETRNRTGDTTIFRRP